MAFSKRFRFQISFIVIKRIINNHEECNSTNDHVSDLFLIGYQFEPHKPQGHWRIIWSLTSGPVELLTYSVWSFCQACWDVLAIAMRGVIFVDVEARIALRMSLSCLTQCVLFGLVMKLRSVEGQGMSPFT